MAEPLNITISLKDVQEASAAGARDHQRDYARIQRRQQQRQALGQAGLGIATGATAGSSLAGADMLSRALESTGQHLKSIGQTIPFGGAVGATAGAAMQASADKARRLNEMAERYGQYSPEVAIAQAQQEVKQIQFEMEQAKKYGTQLSAWVHGQGEMARSFEATRGKSAIEGAPDLLKTMPGVAEAAEWISDKISKYGVEKGLGWIADLLGFGTMPGDAKPKAGAEAAKKGVKEAGAPSIIDGFLDSFGAAGAARGAAVNNAAERWMAATPQLELADIGENVNGIIQKEIGNPAKVHNNRDFTP